MDVKYEIMKCAENTDTTTSRFEYREIGPNYPGLYTSPTVNSPTLTREERIQEISNNNQSYHIHKNDAMHLTGSLNPNLLFKIAYHKNITDAVMAHFNEIQRGNCHPNLYNLINPNAHGKGINTCFNMAGVLYDPTDAARILNLKKASYIKSSAHSKENEISPASILSKVPNAFNPKNFDHNNHNTWPKGNRVHPSSHSNSPHAPHALRGQGSSDGEDPSHRQSSSSKKDIEPHSETKPKGRGIRSPLDQFSIIKWLIFSAPLLGNTSLSYTNMGFYLTIITFIIVIVSALAINFEKIMVNAWSSGQESMYATVYNIVIGQINAIKGQYFYPFIYCLFIFILTSNLVGMIPYNFAPTSHFALTFFISFTVVMGSTFLGFILHKLGFFSLFVPAGCPLGLLPLLVLIEFISYIARNVSLGLRLAANILSGHMLLNILSEFTYKIMETNYAYLIIGIIPLMFIGAFSCLEFGIGFIQAQVFSVLSSSYIKDGLLLH